MDRSMKTVANEQKEDKKAVIKRKTFPFLLMSPFFIVTGIFVIIPICIMVAMSFTNMGLDLKWNFIGLDSYIKLLHDTSIPTIIARTLVFVVLGTVCSVLSSVFIAVVTTFYLDLVYKRETAGILFRILWLLPSLTPSVVYAFIWYYVFGATEYGLLNTILSAFSIPAVTWLARYPQVILFLICVLSSASGSIVLFSAAVRQIPEHILQAAKVDGAPPLAICRKIVLPYLKWPIMQKALWSVLGFFCTYEIIYLLTKGGPYGQTTTFAYYIYQNAFSMKMFGVGAALAVILVAMSSILGLVVLRVFKVEKQLQDPRMDL